MDNIVNKITGIAEERFKEEDLLDCFLVDIDIQGRKLEVYIDSDSGVKFQQCQKLSRAIEAWLDESLVLGDKYILEVSSPGVDRPLKFKRQYHKHVGRNIRITLKSEGEVEGRLEDIRDDIVIVSIKGKKKTADQVREIGFDDIEKANILITFSK